MTYSDQREPTNEDLWAQPPASASSTYPGQSLAPVTPPAPSPVPRHHRDRDRSGTSTGATPDKASFVIAIISLGVAIPLTAIAAGVSGLPGLLIVWVGLVMVNFVFGMTRRPR